MQQSLLDRAREFHGHLGPFVVLGLRMGACAAELLGGMGSPTGNWALPRQLRAPNARGIRQLADRQAAGKRHFGISIIVRCPDAPPPSCLVDGLQLSTGCTMGKRNIELRPDSEILVTVRSEDPPRQVVLRPVIQALEQAQQMMREQGDEAAARWLWGLPDDQVFTHVME